LITYKFGGIEYKILTDEGEKRDEQVLRDFLHCEKKRDYQTIKNRITNGLMWGWLTEIKK